MRRLILAAALGLALPAFAADDPAPATQAAPEPVAGMPDPAMAEAAATPDVAEAAPAPTDMAPETTEAAAPERPPVSPDAVARNTFATGIDQREPVDSITTLGSDEDLVYYFTEFVGLAGRRLTHRWEYEGEVVAEVPIVIDGPRWRAYSSKNLDESRLGEWTVSIVDESGRVVRTDGFVYEQAAPAPAVAAATGEDEAPASAADTPAPQTAPETADRQAPSAASAMPPAAPAAGDAADE